MQENRITLPDSLKSLVSVIEDIRHSMRELETRVKYFDRSFDRLEAELERQLSVQSRTTREIQKLKNELETIKTTMLVNEQANTVMQNNVTAAAVDEENLKQPVHTPSFSKPEAPPARQAEYVPQKQSSPVPVMQGSGFSHVTLDYLKKIGGK